MPKPVQQSIQIPRGSLQTVDVRIPAAEALTPALQASSEPHTDGAAAASASDATDTAAAAHGAATAGHEEAPKSVARNTMIEWEMTVDKYDIAFCVEFIPSVEKDSDAQTELVQHKLRLEQDQNAFTPEAEVDGIIRFTFDNKYSMMRGKTVQFGYELVNNEHSRSGLTELIQNVDDPVEMHRIGSLISLKDSRNINHAGYRGVQMFFENRLVEAEQYFLTNRNRFPVFSLGYATMAYLKAMMTWTPEDIERAVDRLEHTKVVAEAFAPKTSMMGSIGKMFGGKATKSTDTDPIQVESSLVTAETTLVRSMLHLMEETMMGFVRAGLSVRAGWKIYTECDNSLNKVVSAHVSRENRERIASKSFEEQIEELVQNAQSIVPGLDRSVIGGIQFGWGTFNLIISVMPPIILRIVEALGFPSDREAGILQLKLCMEGNGLRAPLAALMLLTYHVLLPSFIPTGLVLAHHAARAESIINEMLSRFNDSALFLWISGRLERMRRNISKSIEILEYCSSLQHDWVQLRHLCAYELGFCEAFRLDWARAADQFRMLEDENTWSKPFYGYMRAVASQELGRSYEVEQHLKRIREYEGIKLSGKKISIEQFVDRRSNKVLERAKYGNNQGLMCTPNGTSDEQDLVVNPVFSTVFGSEMLFLFNGYSQMQTHSLYAVLQEIDCLLLHWNGLLRFTASSTLIQRERKKERVPEEVTATSDYMSCAGGSQNSEKLKFSVFDLLESAAERSYSENVELASKSLVDAMNSLFGDITTDDVLSLGDEDVVENVAVLALCRGALLSQLSRAEEAHACLDWVLDKKKNIKEENFVVPFAHYEKAVLYGPSPEAAQHLKAAKDFSGDYNFKYRLHLRIHLLQIEFAIGNE
eukprot:gb/GECG01016707.1/.p1 GENE.gb/GECG01016707.1/~~gb/GECG01016707.1/.p1  ORF type:complete len:872 (+),score=112.04 gb/GECG01016707.1/:1-2616(+)